MKKSILISATGLIALGALTACEKMQSKETTSKISDEPSTVLIPSTDEGGLNDFDSTGRLQLESYQKAQRTSTSGAPAHFGEVIRIDLMDSQAKGAIAFRENYLGDSDTPRTTFWMVSHGEANSSTEEEPFWHNHTSFEIPDETGQLQTVLEMPFGKFNEPNAYGVPLDEMYVRTTEKFIASNKGIYVEGDPKGDRTIKFSTGTYTTNEDRRFAIGIDGSEETGDDMGSNFRVINYSDNGEYKGTSLAVDRSTNDVGINTSTPTSPLHVDGDTIRLAQKRTISSSNEPGEQGEYCWDDNYWYVCVSQNTWKRFSLESW